MEKILASFLKFKELEELDGKCMNRRLYLNLTNVHLVEKRIKIIL